MHNVSEMGPNIAKTLELSLDGVVLNGDLRVPENAQALVVFVHGSGSSRLSPRNQYVAEVLNEAKLATLLFDLLTAEEEEADRVHGHLRFDIGLLTRRVVEVTKLLLDSSEVSKLEIGYFGASTGAAAALVAASRLPNLINAVVSRGGRPDLAGNALIYVTAPTLLIVGERDHTVLQLNYEALELLGGPKDLAVVHGATHLFEERGTLQTAAKLASAWFSKYLINPHGI